MEITFPRSRADESEALFSQISYVTKCLRRPRKRKKKTQEVSEDIQNEREKAEKTLQRFLFSLLLNFLEEPLFSCSIGSPAESAK